MSAQKKDYIKIIKTAGSSLSIAFKAAPLLTLAYVISFAVSGITPVIQIWLTKNILDQIIGVVSKNPSKSVNEIFIFIGIAIAVRVFESVCVTISFLTYSRLNDELSKFIQISLIKQSLRLDMAYFESPEFYNQYEKVRNSIESRLRRAVQDSANLITYLLTFVSISVLLINIHWSLIPVIIIINLPTLIWGMGYSMVTYSLSNSLVAEGRKADYIHELATHRDSVKEVKLFGLGNYLLDKYQKYFDILIKENWKVTKPKFFGAFATTLVADSAYYGFYIWAILQTIASKLTIGDLNLYIQSFSRASGSLSGMLRYINDLFEHVLYIEDYLKFMKVEPKIVDLPASKPLNEIKKIKFENVSFKYKEDLPFVLKNISFEINENENIALVGQNGAGKTTIIKLLMRFYDTTEGTIYINDIDIKKYKITDLWKQMGTVFQDFEKYQLTVRENIGLGQVENINNLEKILQAAKKSGANEFISALEAKYETMLGTRFENSSDLSIGQWQKVAIARAFFRECSVMILDEPTAAIDAKAEYEIFKRFVDLVEGKICILISHRFSTVRLANKILVVENGKLLESGSHEDLIKNNGRYAELFNLQAEGYK